jgi:hypothetical protein
MNYKRKTKRMMKFIEKKDKVYGFYMTGHSKGDAKLFD